MSKSVKYYLKKVEHDPLISVIVPCYQQGHFLEEALASVKAQTYENWECLVINDGSPDNTQVIGEKWAAQDARFRIFTKKNGGLSSARNLGLDNAKGDFIQFLDADDLLQPGKFSKSLSSPGGDIVVSGFGLFTHNIVSATVPPFELTEPLFSFESILLGWDDQFVIPIHCGFFKASLFEKLRFDESLSAKEDWLMWLQLYKGQAGTKLLKEILAFYRMSPGSMSQNNRNINENLVKVYQTIYSSLPESLKGKFFVKAVQSLGKSLSESYELLEKTRDSKSYRLGNFFIRNLNRLRIKS